MRDDGGTERDHLESARRQLANMGIKSKKITERLDQGPPCPPELRYLWRHFCEIVTGVASNGMGATIITWEGLAAWCGLRGIALEPWESLTLVRLGQLRADVAWKAMKTGDKGRGA